MTKLLTGTVVSLKMQKTAVVSIEETHAHPLYKKTVRTTKRYKAHIPEAIKPVLEDTVVIRETRPMSRDKHFIIEKIVTK